MGLYYLSLRVNVKSAQPCLTRQLNSHQMNYGLNQAEGIEKKKQSYFHSQNGNKSRFPIEYTVAHSPPFLRYVIKV